MTISHHKGLQAGDAFLLCSDGLWCYTDDVAMGHIIAENSPRKAAELLIAGAREKGQGKNAGNCTMAIVRLLPAAPEPKRYTATRL